MLPIPALNGIRLIIGTERTDHHKEVVCGENFIFGDPENSTSNQLPGSVLLGLGKRSPPGLPESLDKLGEQMDAIDVNTDAGIKIMDYIKENIKDDGLEKVTYDTVYKRMNTPDGGTYRFIIKNAEGDSIGGAYYTGPPKKKK